MKHQHALAQLARETARARARLALERAMRAGLPLGLALGLWGLAALSGLHEKLPPLLQSLSAIAALGIFIWLGLGARGGFRAPSEAEARARLAGDCALELCAFEALRDRPARYDAIALALWRAEQAHAGARAEHARAGPLRARLDTLDPFKTRYLIGAALLVCLVLAGAAAPQRLARAFAPDPGPLLGDKPMAVEAWVAPAEYTHAAPVSLSDRLGERIETPPSVQANVRVTGPVGAPVLVFDGKQGRRRARFIRAADGAWEAQLDLPGAGRLKIVRFHTSAFWTIAAATDHPPAAFFAAPLALLADEQVALRWRAQDDFGLARLALRVRLADPPASLAHAGAIDTEIDFPAGDPRQGEGESELDLAAHAYAGMAVEARLVAFDALGQEGESAPLHFTLPEKVFLQPLARAAIEIRRHILTERRPYRQARRERRRTIAAGGIVLGNERIELRDPGRAPALARARRKGCVMPRGWPMR